MIGRTEATRDRGSRNIGDCSAVREGIVAAIPSLRAFAVSLSGNLDRADDLVQDTRALANIRSFQPETNCGNVIDSRTLHDVSVAFLPP